jgi:hypothetical protein
VDNIRTNPSTGKGPNSNDAVIMKRAPLLTPGASFDKSADNDPRLAPGRI